MCGSDGSDAAIVIVRTLGGSTALAVRAAVAREVSRQPLVRALATGARASRHGHGGAREYGP